MLINNFFFKSQFSIFRHLAILKNLKHFRFSSSICFYIVDEIEFKYLLVYFNFENKSILLHCFQKAVAENLIKVDPPWIFHHIESIENIIFNGSIVNVKLIYIVVLAWDFISHYASSSWPNFYNFYFNLLFVYCQFLFYW